MIARLSVKVSAARQDRGGRGGGGGSNEIRSQGLRVQVAI